MGKGSTDSPLLVSTAPSGKKTQPGQQQQHTASASLPPRHVPHSSLSEKSRLLVSSGGKQESSWGRSTAPSTLGSLVMLITPPLLVNYFLVSCTLYECRLQGIPQSLAGLTSLADFVSLLSTWLPRPTFQSAYIWLGWLLFQAFLQVVVPSQIGYGQETPAGRVLPYRVNGLRCYLLSHALFIAGSYVGLWRLSVIAHNFPGLFVWANIGGYFMTAFCFLKAHLFPSHADDRKFSGSFLYDVYMGIEFNPRIGQLFDFKLFFNGRPGIIAWTTITISFAAAQREAIGYITNSMFLVLALHALYVVDFFYNEDWYLRTIDIAHDHMGFYLCWGDLVWLPLMYTLQGQYLYRNPVDLHPAAVAGIVSLGAFGYYIFRATNYQKDIVRRTDGECNIWGRKPDVIRAHYRTVDGVEHTSLLLCSGWWGVARQINYLGDICMSLAMCLCCGLSLQAGLGYFYFFWMVGLLTHRTYRSDQRCRQKYGPTWDEYCRRVPYKILPGVF